MAPSEDETEPPLDPAMQRVQAKLRRLMLVGGLTLAIGIVAVFVAILYRITRDDAPPPAASGPLVPGTPGETAAATVSLAALGLPDGARLTASAATADRVVLTYEAAGETFLILIEPVTGRVAGVLRLAR